MPAGTGTAAGDGLRGDGAAHQKRLSWRYADAADIRRYYDEPLRLTVRAVVVFLDDEPVGMAGLAYHADRYIAFSEFKPELEPYLKSMTVLRAVKAAQRMILTANLPVVVVDSTNPALMLRLGFIEIAPGVHLCRG